MQLGGGLGLEGPEAVDLGVQVVKIGRHAHLISKARDGQYDFLQTLCGDTFRFSQVRLL